MSYKKIKLEDALQPFFEFYNEDNEYELKLPDGNFTPTATHCWESLYPKAKIIKLPEQLMPDGKRTPYRLVVPRDVLNSLSPDNIDNQEFWRIVSKQYKCFAVAGGPKTNRTTSDVNNSTFKMAQGLGAIRQLDEKFKNIKNGKMLEIGYGYGNVAFYMQQYNKDVEYYGIDVVDRIIVLKNLFETNGWDIPEQIPTNLDVIYSVNVFQHLSQKQRWNYFEKAKKYLKRGGIMIFSSFVMTDENKDDGLWGLVDYHGRGYCHFFNQPTEVDWDHELLGKFNELNFEIVQYFIPENCKNFLYCVIKKK